MLKAILQFNNILLKDKITKVIFAFFAMFVIVFYKMECSASSHITKKDLSQPSVIVSSSNKDAVGDIRIGLHKGFTRFVIEIPEDRDIKVLSNEQKLTIIIKNYAVSYFDIEDNSRTKSPFDGITSAIDKNGNTILTADLKSDSKIISTLSIPKNQGSGFRFVIDMTTTNEQDNIDTISKVIKITELEEDIIRSNQHSKKQSQYYSDEFDPKFSTIVMNEVLNEDQITLKRKQKQKSKTVVAYKNTKPVIVIDAGHGGTDPGAIGSKYNTREKDITIRYALLTYAKLKKIGKYDVKLTRAGDYTIDLKTRRDLAAKYNADLFISIHADHHPKKDTRGLSVYTLSNSSSDDVAKQLAESHEEGQIIGGIKFNQKDKALSNIIVDLERRKSAAESVRFAELVLNKMQKNKIKMLFNTHRFAGFAVLKGADVPSILIEIGFLSNKYEEGLLRSTNHKQIVTNAIVQAVDNYFQTKK